MEQIFELTPQDSRKSFYGKAKVLLHGTTAQLLSYTTIVSEYNTESKEYKQFLNKPSQTTARHIRAFKSFYSID